MTRADQFVPYHPVTILIVLAILSIGSVTVTFAQLPPRFNTVAEQVESLAAAYRIYRFTPEGVSVGTFWSLDTYETSNHTQWH